jgi:uncharacterized damage-inducible protein DinB
MSPDDHGYDTDPERHALHEFLSAQRESVLAIVDGLEEPLLRTSVVSSGWTPLGLVEHLTGAEYFWIQIVLLGNQPPQPADEAPEAGPWGPFVTDRPVEEVIEEYRQQGALSDATIQTLPLGTAPRFRPGWVGAEEAKDLRWILLHLIEETSRHAGHLDLARELLDGRTGLGPR